PVLWEDVRAKTHRQEIYQTYMPTLQSLENEAREAKQTHQMLAALTVDLSKEVDDLAKQLLSDEAELQAWNIAGDANALRNWSTGQAQYVLESVAEMDRASEQVTYAIGC